ncbi:MAG: hypothetical protein ABIP39_14995 [Polyangiaceae bacterium]
MKRNLMIAAVTLGLFACGGSSPAVPPSAPSPADPSTLTGPPTAAPTEPAPAEKPPGTMTTTTTVAPTPAPSKKGEACGDDVAVLKKCATGLKCVPTKTGPVSEHTPGICQ